MEKTDQENRQRFLTGEQRLEKLEILLKSKEMTAFEYFPEQDRLTLYDENLLASRSHEGYAEYLLTSRMIHPDDRWKILDFLKGNLPGPIELRTKDKEGNDKRRVLDAVYLPEERMLVGYTRDITEEKTRKEILEEQARRDSKTMLYNHFWGKTLIEEYLGNRDPYDFCALLLMDIDYFKNVNDTYGHLFGDRVLQKLAEILKDTFDQQDILIREGGDEFVVFLKHTDKNQLMNKVSQLFKRIRSCRFPENPCTLSCSVGICFLPENRSGFTYDQMFENADWALYQAKLNGRDRYEFCDHLQRFANIDQKSRKMEEEIDIRYRKNDIVATAFEIFAKTNSFDAAIDLLLKVIGIRYRLDRITVILTDLKEQEASRRYQWCSSKAPAVLEISGGFAKEDFLTLFHSYDEYGTTVLQYDNMGMYSKEAEQLLMQGEAKTVLYAAMYCEGQYVGAISYVVCTDKRHWSKKSRSEIGELTKLISAHLSKKMTMNAFHSEKFSIPDFDSLTGLLSFAHFREEVERLIVGAYARPCVVVYEDFDNFCYINQKYGYKTGDLLLKEFSNYMMERLILGSNTYFTRVVADQFVLFIPGKGAEEAAKEISAANEEFAQIYGKHFPEYSFRIRAGIYPVAADCSGASAAIDAANYARKQTGDERRCCVRIYDDSLKKKQKLDNEILNGIDRALSLRQFQVYLQPKVLAEDGTLVGAEAQARWIREDGSTLHPTDFIPLYEKNGRVIDLDLYIFEEVVKFLKKNEQMGRRQLPISMNASALLASSQDAADSYLEILRQYEVDPGLVEIELTETEAASDYEKVKQLFQRFREAGIKTSLDDFGSGYSMVNILVDIPADTVKLDRSLLERCENNVRGQYLLRQMIQMIRRLGYEVLCEGVETEEQLTLLKASGCSQVQGYYFYRPMSVAEYEALLYDQKGSQK